MPRWRVVVSMVILSCCVSAGAWAQSRRGELRGAWMESGYGRDWSAIMESLADSGFNALFPNFSVGNMAFYPSDVLDVAPRGEEGRDELAEAAKAAKEHGIELHVWRINWALSNTPPEQLEELDQAGRVQRNSRGQRGKDDPSIGVDWLCPSDPENRKLEKASMLEVVRRYDIAGIHFDYMRFPGGDYCFCDGCKKRFQEDAGVHVERWPGDVLESGPYAQQWQQWRQQLQMSLVKEISREAHRIKPEVYISLAAWPYTDVGRDLLGQDWPQWIHEGALDFVCPMDYTLDEQELAGLIGAQVDAVQAEIPLYAGLAAFKMKSPDALGERMEIARAAGADGFVVFAYGSGELAEWLLDLRATVTAAGPDPMPHRSPPGHFAFAGPAIEAPASQRNLVAGQQLEAQIAVGESPLRGSEEEPGEGAAQAASILRQATETRSPVTTYGREPELIPSLTEEMRIFGRIVVETPSGMVLLPLGAFSTDFRMERTARFPCPEGAFRIAVYGSTRVGGGVSREFVVRSPLLIGMEEADLRAEAAHRELDQLCADACGREEIGQLLHLDVAVQVRATGPGGGEWWFRLRDGECSTGEGTVEDPDLTLVGTTEDLLAILRGESRARTMWEVGRLKVSGEESLLRRLAELLPDA